MHDTLSTLSNLPLVLQAAMITGLLALLGVIVTTSITRGQLEVSRQTLFVSMLPRRIDWLDKFRKAVEEWDGQMQTIINYEGYDPPEPTALFEMGRLTQEATWLFGNEVAKAADDIEVQLEKVKGLRIRARAGGDTANEAAMEVGHAVFEAYQLFEPLNEAIRAKLYVGDIENKKAPKSTPLHRS